MAISKNRKEGSRYRFMNNSNHKIIQLHCYYSQEFSDKISLQSPHFWPLSVIPLVLHFLGASFPQTVYSHSAFYLSQCVKWFGFILKYHSSVKGGRFRNRIADLLQCKGWHLIESSLTSLTPTSVALTVEMIFISIGGMPLKDRRSQTKLRRKGSIPIQSKVAKNSEAVDKWMLRS